MDDQYSECISNSSKFPEAASIVITGAASEQPVESTQPSEEPAIDLTIQLQFVEVRLKEKEEKTDQLNRQATTRPHANYSILHLSPKPKSQIAQKTAESFSLLAGPPFFKTLSSSLTSASQLS